MTQGDFNFMDLLNDDAWFEAAARREESVQGDALAGYSWRSHLGAVMANPSGYSHLTQMRSMVMQAWQQLVTEWDLGIGAEAAITQGQELIRERLQQPEPDIQAMLLALLEAKLSKPQGEWVMTEAIHNQIRQVFARILTPEDWQTIAASAIDLIDAQVLKQACLTVESQVRSNG